MTISEEDIKHVEKLLDERHDIAVQTDENMGNPNGECFLPTNPDYIYYEGMLDALIALGLCPQCTRVNGRAKHRVF